MSWPVALYGMVLAVFAVVVSVPDLGEPLFRGFFIQDADEIIRSWYGRCAFTNPNIVPYSHLSMPGWAAILGVGEAIGRVIGLPFTLPGRLVSVGMSVLALVETGRLIRRVGGTERQALLTGALLAASPAWFLLSISVYPSVTLAALLLSGARRYLDDQQRSAALLVGLAPLIRWEGALVLALFAVFFLWRRRFSAFGWLMLPYVLYLGTTALRFGNPWAPLAYRTTRHMGAWLIFNPWVDPVRLQEGIINLVTFYSPVVLVFGLPVAAWAVWRHLRALGPLPMAFGGLTISLLSIQHEFMVYALRVFATPLALGLVTIAAVAVRSAPALRRTLFVLATLGTLTSLTMTWVRINKTPIPERGRARYEVGFHPMVRYADASADRDWLLDQKVEWLIVNHLNANLLRADATCSLWDQPLRIGGPAMNLGRDFRPIFSLPDGEGIVVFHTLPTRVDACTEVLENKKTGQRAFRCPATSPALVPAGSPANPPANPAAPQDGAPRDD